MTDVLIINMLGSDDHRQYPAEAGWRWSTEHIAYLRVWHPDRGTEFYIPWSALSHVVINREFDDESIDVDTDIQPTTATDEHDHDRVQAGGERPDGVLQ